MTKTPLSFTAGLAYTRSQGDYPSRAPGEQVLRKRCSVKGQVGNSEPVTAEARKPRIKCREHFCGRDKSSQLAVRNRARWRGAEGAVFDG